MLYILRSFDSLIQKKDHYKILFSISLNMYPISGNGSNHIRIKFITYILFIINSRDNRVQIRSIAVMPPWIKYEYILRSYVLHCISIELNVQYRLELIATYRRACNYLCAFYTRYIKKAESKESDFQTNS